MSTEEQDLEYARLARAKAASERNVAALESKVLRYRKALQDAHDITSGKGTGLWQRDIPTEHEILAKIEALPDPKDFAATFQELVSSRIELDELTRQLDAFKL